MCVCVRQYARILHVVDVAFSRGGRVVYCGQLGGRFVEAAALMDTVLELCRLLFWHEALSFYPIRSTIEKLGQCAQK